MKITSIKQQVGRTDRYSVFVDDKYSFSLSERALLASKVHSGQELSASQVGEFKKLSNDDKLYSQTLKYASMRRKTYWEVEFYLKRKNASPALSDQILNMLSNLNIVNDLDYAKAYIRDRNLIRPASSRKLYLDLRKKHVSDKVIKEAMESEGDNEASALQAVIDKKRRQTKYQDDTKLMQYLARQGFKYDDIKKALRVEE